MSAIYKLSISGVRSFDARQPETIEFGKPLTLIVGPNGTGKTTIIECLKYATTGDLPPNSKGGAFVHDPGMYGEKEVKAEVKLAFQSLSGNSMVCTRNMQVLAKKGAASYTFKTLEGQLLQMNRGERTTISTKCAELDDLLPKNLGTPRPILDYVIFCHQEESLWPLSEPLTLKKRFDEIFEALKFTKALDNLKVIRKDMAVEIKLLDQSVKHLKLDKDRAQRTREKMEKNKELLERYKDEIVILEEEIAEVTRESDQLFKSNQEFQQVLSRLESMKHEERSLTEQLNRLHDSCTLLPDRDEELEYKIANFQSVIEKGTQHVEQLRNTLAEHQTVLHGLREEHNGLIREEGQLKAKEDEYEMNLLTRDDAVTTIGEQFGIATDVDVGAVEVELTQLKDTQEKKLDELVKTVEAKEAEMQRAIQKLSDSRLTELQHKQYATTDITSLESEIKEIQARVNNLNVNEGNLAYEKSALEGLESKLLNFRQNKSLEQFVQEIRTRNNEVSVLENEIDSVSHDIAQTHKHSDAHAKISLLTDELKFKENAVTKLMETNGDAFAMADLDTTDLQGSYTQRVEELKRELQQKEKTLAERERETAKVSNELAYKQDSLRQLSTTSDESEKKFKKMLPNEEVEDYDEVVASAEEDYKAALGNLKMITTTLQFNKKALEVAERTECCYLCSRKFDDAPLLQTFISELKRKTDGGLDNDMKTELKEAKDYLDSVRALASDVDVINSTKDKLSQLEREVGEITEELVKMKAEKSLEEEGVKQLRDALGDLDGLRNAVSDIVRLKSDIASTKEQLETKQKELNDCGYSSHSLDELQENLSKKNDTLKALRKIIVSLQEEKENVQREQNMLEGSVKDKRLMISNIERSLIERENLTRSIEDNKKKIVTLKETVAKSEEIIGGLDSQIKSMNEELEKVKQENYAAVKSQRDYLSTITAKHDELIPLSRRIREYEQTGSTKLKECQQRARTVSDSINKLETTIKKTTDTINEEELRLADSASEERNLRANIDLRQLQVRLNNVQRDIEGMDVQNAEAQRDEYQKRSNDLRQQYTNLRSELAGKRGEIRQIEDQAAQLEKELNTEFKDVEKNFREEWTKLQTRTVVNDDLATYSKALDNAIMGFHALKMKEINRIIDELWKSTYSGSDVDTIQIKSEPSGKANRSYNYRVVMVKQDAELDMRGRCSAGQKVLAAIIIRLALSECFGTNCGVIALDEPTTNLDADNIESLAHSLGKIIEMRRAQKNFQLIVITHDEKFLNSMSAAKYTDHFFRLKRDESQNSQIEWVDIARVTE